MLRTALEPLEVIMQRGKLGKLLNIIDHSGSFDRFLIFLSVCV